MLFGQVVLIGWLLATALAVLICVLKRRWRSALTLGALSIALPVATMFGLIYGLPRAPGDQLGLGFVALHYAGIVAAIVSALALIAALSVGKRRSTQGKLPPERVAPWLEEMRQNLEHKSPPNP